MKIVVLDGYAVNPGDLDWKFLDKYGEAVIYAKTADEDCADKCKDADIVFTNRAKITADLLDKCPSVKYISALGTGYDMIDISACRSHGVAVVNIPGYSTDSVAQHTIRLLLELFSDLKGMQDIVREGMWTGVPGYRYDKVRYTELCGLTLGLIGCGNIGKKVADIAYALGMNVVASTANPHVDTDAVSYVGIEELKKKSDIISLHCPLNDSTRGMIDKKFIEGMKHGAMLINTSRGAVLNELDVADALNSGRLGGAAVDVLAVEPALKNNPLLSASNCIITPHIAWASKAARIRLMRVIEDSLCDFTNGGSGLNRIV